MRHSLLLFASLLAAPAAHADSLDCDAAFGDTKLKASSPLVDGNADAQLARPFGLDASLGPGSLMLVFEDTERARRVAFAGSQLAISPDGLTLESGPAKVACHLNPEKPVSVAPPALPEQPDYLACAVDEAHFAGGVPVDSKRQLTTLTSPLAEHKPLAVAGENDAVSFRVAYTSWDPFHGLDVTLTDKTTGEVTHYVGPARSMVKSFLFGITFGDRAVDARFLRLGCMWTDDPKALAAPASGAATK